MGGCWGIFAGRYLGSRAATVRRGQASCRNRGGAFSAGGAYERMGFPLMRERGDREEGREGFQRESWGEFSEA